MATGFVNFSNDNLALIQSLYEIYLGQKTLPSFEGEQERKEIFRYGRQKYTVGNIRDAIASITDEEKRKETSVKGGLSNEKLADAFADFCTIYNSFSDQIGEDKSFASIKAFEDFFNDATVEQLQSIAGNLRNDTDDTFRNNLDTLIQAAGDSTKAKAGLLNILSDATTTATAATRMQEIDKKEGTEENGVTPDTKKTEKQTYLRDVGQAIGSLTKPVYGKNGEKESLSVADATTIYTNLFELTGADGEKLFENVDDFSEFFLNATVEQLQKIAWNLQAHEDKGYKAENVQAFKNNFADLIQAASGNEDAEAGLLNILSDAELTGEVAQRADKQNYLAAIGSLTKPVYGKNGEKESLSVAEATTIYTNLFELTGADGEKLFENVDDFSEFFLNATVEQLQKIAWNLQAHEDKGYKAENVQAFKNNFADLIQAASGNEDAKAGLLNILSDATTTATAATRMQEIDKKEGTEENGVTPDTKKTEKQTYIRDVGQAIGSLTKPVYGKNGEKESLSVAEATTIYTNLSELTGADGEKLFKNVDDFSEFFLNATVEQLQKIAWNLQAHEDKGYKAENVQAFKNNFADLIQAASGNEDAEAGLLNILSDAELTGRVAGMKLLKADGINEETDSAKIKEAKQNYLVNTKQAIDSLMKSDRKRGTEGTQSLSVADATTIYKNLCAAKNFKYFADFKDFFENATVEQLQSIAGNLRNDTDDTFKNNFDTLMQAAGDSTKAKAGLLDIMCDAELTGRVAGMKLLKADGINEETDSAKIKEAKQNYLVNTKQAIDSLMKSDRKRGTEGTQSLSVADATTIYTNLFELTGADGEKLFENVDDFSEFFLNATVEQLQKIAWNLQAHEDKGYKAENVQAFKNNFADLIQAAGDSTKAKAGLLNVMCDVTATATAVDKINTISRENVTEEIKKAKKQNRLIVYASKKGIQLENILKSKKQGSEFLNEIVSIFGLFLMRRTDGQQEQSLRFLKQASKGDIEKIIKICKDKQKSEFIYKNFLTGDLSERNPYDLFCILKSEKFDNFFEFFKASDANLGIFGREKRGIKSSIQPSEYEHIDFIGKAWEKIEDTTKDKQQQYINYVRRFAQLGEDEGFEDDFLKDIFLINDSKSADGKSLRGTGEIENIYTHKTFLKEALTISDVDHESILKLASRSDKDGFDDKVLSMLIHDEEGNLRTAKEVENISKNIDMIKNIADNLRSKKINKTKTTNITSFIKEYMLNLVTLSKEEFNEVKNQLEGIVEDGKGKKTDEKKREFLKLVNFACDPKNREKTGNKVSIDIIVNIAKNALQTNPILNPVENFGGLFRNVDNIKYLKKYANNADDFKQYCIANSEMMEGFGSNSSEYTKYITTASTFVSEAFCEYIKSNDEIKGLKHEQKIKILQAANKALGNNEELRFEKLSNSGTETEPLIIFALETFFDPTESGNKRKFSDPSGFADFIGSKNLDSLEEIRIKLKGENKKKYKDFISNAVEKGADVEDIYNILSNKTIIPEQIEKILKFDGEKDDCKQYYKTLGRLLDPDRILKDDDGNPIEESKEGELPPKHSITENIGNIIELTQNFYNKFVPDSKFYLFFNDKTEAQVQTILDNFNKPAGKQAEDETTKTTIDILAENNEKYAGTIANIRNILAVKELPIIEDINDKSGETLSLKSMFEKYDLSQIQLVNYLVDPNREVKYKDVKKENSKITLRAAQKLAKTIRDAEIKIERDEFSEIFGNMLQADIENISKKTEFLGEGKRLGISVENTLLMASLDGFDDNDATTILTNLATQLDENQIQELCKRVKRAGSEKSEWRTTAEEFIGRFEDSAKQKATRLVYTLVSLGKKFEKIGELSDFLQDGRLKGTSGSDGIDLNKLENATQLLMCGFEKEEALEYAALDKNEVFEKFSILKGEEYKSEDDLTKEEIKKFKEQVNTVLKDSTNEAKYFSTILKVFTLFSKGDDKKALKDFIVGFIGIEGDEVKKEYLDNIHSVVVSTLNYQDKKDFISKRKGDIDKLSKFKDQTSKDRVLQGIMKRKQSGENISNNEKLEKIIMNLNAAGYNENNNKLRNSKAFLQEKGNKKFVDAFYKAFELIENDDGKEDKDLKKEIINILTNGNNPLRKHFDTLMEKVDAKEKLKNILEYKDSLKGLLEKNKSKEKNILCDETDLIKMGQRIILAAAGEGKETIAGIFDYINVITDEKEKTSFVKAVNEAFELHDKKVKDTDGYKTITAETEVIEILKNETLRKHFAELMAGDNKQHDASKLKNISSNAEKIEQILRAFPKKRDGDYEKKAVNLVNFIINIREKDEEVDIKKAINNLANSVLTGIDNDKKKNILDNFDKLKEKIQSSITQCKNFVDLLANNDEVAKKFVSKLTKKGIEEAEDFFYLQGNTLKNEGRKKYILGLIKGGVSAKAALELDKVKSINDEDLETLSTNSGHIARFIENMTSGNEKSDKGEEETRSEINIETQKNIIISEFAKFTSQLENKDDFKTAISRLSGHGNKYAEIIGGIGDDEDEEQQKVILGSLLLLALHNDNIFDEDFIRNFKDTIGHYEDIQGSNETKSAIIAVLLSNKEEIGKNDEKKLKEKISTIAEVVERVEDPKKKFEVTNDLLKLSLEENITNDILKKLTANYDKIDSEKVRSCTKNLAKQSENISKIIDNIEKDDDKLCFAESLSFGSYYNNFDKKIETISGNLSLNFNKAIEEAKELTEAEKVGYIYNLMRVSEESSGKEAVFETNKEKILKNIENINSICTNFDSDSTLQKAFYIGLMRSVVCGYFPSDDSKVTELKDFFDRQNYQNMKDEKSDIVVASGESVFFTTYVLSTLEDRDEDRNTFKGILLNNIKPKFIGELFSGIDSTLWINYKDNPELLKEISSHEEAQTLNEFVKQGGDINKINSTSKDKDKVKTLDSIIKSIVEKGDGDYKEKEEEIKKELRYKNLKETIEYLNNKLGGKDEIKDIKDLVQIRRDRENEIKKGSVKNIMDSFLDLAEGTDEPSKKIKEAQNGMNKDAYESIPKLKSFENRRKQLSEKANHLKDFVLMHKTRAETARSVLSTLEYYDDEIETQNAAEEPDEEYLKYLKEAKKEYINKIYNGKKEKGEKWELGRQAINKQKKINTIIVSLLTVAVVATAVCGAAVFGLIAAAVAVVAVAVAAAAVAGTVITIIINKGELKFDKESLLKLQAKHDVDKSNNILKAATGNIINENGKLEKTGMVDEKTKIKTSKSKFGKLNLTVDKGETAIKKITTDYYKKADEDGGKLLESLENIRNSDSQTNAISGMLNGQSNIFKRSNQR